MLKEWTVRLLVGFFGLIKICGNGCLEFASGFSDKSVGAIAAAPVSFVKDVYHEVRALTKL